MSYPTLQRTSKSHLFSSHSLTHHYVKRDLLGPDYSEEKNWKTPQNVTKYHEFIHIAKSSPVLPLPDDVEVIVLLRAGLQALLSEEGYATLVDPLTDIRQLSNQEQERK